MNEIRKYWLSEDRQSSLGSWPITAQDAEIWEELKEQGHDGTGTIEQGEWSE